MIRALITVILLTAMAAPADAQLFRRRSCVGGHCNTGYSNFNHYQAPVQQFVPVIQEQQPSTTVVINNATPAPIGGSGNTLYGYPQGNTYAQQFNYGNNAPYTLDPGQLMREAARLTDNAANLHSDALSGYQDTADQLANQALQNQRISALTDLLDRIGVGDPLTGVSQPSQPFRQQQQVQRQQFNAGNNGDGGTTLPRGACLKICPDGNGGLTIRVDNGGGGGASSQQMAAPHSGTDGGFTHPGATVFQNNCLSCHTANSTIPFVDAAGSLSMSAAARAKAVQLASSGAMPPPMNNAGQSLDPLSDDDFVALRAFLEGQ